MAAANTSWQSSREIMKTYDELWKEILQIWPEAMRFEHYE
jgi:hypothetical protein